ncbi:MAG: STAS domain-containing protein [SAR324 cluster bacterium]|nr:STAS domain-containing protein [SAR324 cluster bacterium]
MNFSHRIENNVYIVNVKGHLVEEYLPAFKSYILELINKQKLNAIIINTTQIASIDSAGLGSLVHLFKLLQDNSIKMVFHQSDTGYVTKAFKFARMGSMIPLFQTENEAFASFHI